MSSPFLVGAPLTSSVFSQVWSRNPAIRFGTSGLLGNAVFYGLDKMLFPVIVRAAARLSVSNRSSTIISGSKWTNANAASVSFFVAYLLDIAVQHFLNAWLVFGLDTIRTRELYLSSLSTSYTAYFGTLCGSTVLQSYLLRWGLSRQLAFWSTIILGSLVNYVILTSLNAADKGTAETAKTSSGVYKNNRDLAMVPIWTATFGKSDKKTNIVHSRMQSWKSHNLAEDTRWKSCARLTSERTSL